MSAEVGGEMEAVPARRSLAWADQWRLGLLLFAAAGIHVWLVAHTAIPARDSLGYARIALNIDNPNAGLKPGETRQRIDVIREAEQPPGYPLAILAVDCVLRRICDLPVPDRSLLASQIANSLAAVLLVVPMYLIGRLLFGRNVGFGAALIFQVLPVPARVTSDGLSEGLFLLTVSTATFLGARAARRPSIGGFLLCGIATGCGYLVRPEGLMVSAAVGLVIVLAGLSRRWPRDVALGRLTALCVGVAFVALPYMLLIGKITNKTSPDALTHPFNESPGRIWIGQPGAKAPGGNGALFAAWWDPRVDEGKSRVIWAFGAVGTELLKALHYVVAALTLVAVFAYRRKLLAPDPGLWVLVILSLINLTVLLYLAAKVGYISERHTVLLVMLCCIFGVSAIKTFMDAIASIPLVGRAILWPSATPFLFFVAMVVSAVPYAVKPMHPQREGHKHAGRWLAGQLNQNDFVKDPLAWAEWYAGRTVYRTTVYHTQPDYIWVVWEEGKDSPDSRPHSRLPLWDEAKQLVDAEKAANRPPVFRWPADSLPGSPAVVLYKVKSVKPWAAKQP